MIVENHEKFILKDGGRISVKKGVNKRLTRRVRVSYRMRKISEYHRGGVEKDGAGVK